MDQKDLGIRRSKAIPPTYLSDFHCKKENFNISYQQTGMKVQEIGINMDSREELKRLIIDKAIKTDPGVYIKSLVKPYGKGGIRLWISTHGMNLNLIKKRVNKITELLVELTKDQVDE